MELLSPLAQRFVALGLALLTLLGVLSLIVVPFVDATHAVLDRLAMTRMALARAQAIAAAPAPPTITPFPRAAAIVAPSALAAREQLAGYVTERAAASALQVSVRDIPETQIKAPAPVEIQLSVTGPRDALLTWMSRLETGTPAIRFVHYQLSDAGVPAGSAPTPLLANDASSDEAVPLLRLDAAITTLWVGTP